MHQKQPELHNPALTLIDSTRLSTNWKWTSNSVKAILSFLPNSIACISLTVYFF